MNDYPTELPSEFLELLREATPMELVTLQAEAREVGDEATLKAALDELGRREKAKTK